MASWETCPFCDGTGRRISPPEQSRPGGSTDTRFGVRGSGPRHGYESTYQQGCRCDLCRAGHREYAVAYNARRRAKAAEATL